MLYPYATTESSSNMVHVRSSKNMVHICCVFRGRKDVKNNSSGFLDLDVQFQLSKNWQNLVIRLNSWCSLPLGQTKTCMPLLCPEYVLPYVAHSCFSYQGYSCFRHLLSFCWISSHGWVIRPSLLQTLREYANEANALKRTVVSNIKFRVLFSSFS